MGSAWQIGFGNIGGIIAVYVFLPNTAPRFVLGKSVCIGFLVLAIVSCFIYWVGCQCENRRRHKRTDRGPNLSEEMSRSGDDNPEFRFIL